MLGRRLVATACVWLLAVEGEAGLIAYWDFNDGDLAVDQGAGIVTEDFVGELPYYTGTTKNALDGVGAGSALGLRGGSGLANNGKHLRFLIDTTNYTDIVLSFATRRTSTGFSSNTISYSSDGGNHFFVFGTYEPTTSSTFEVKTFDFAAIPSLDDNPNVILQITFGGATNANGNNRIDNVQITGTVVPEPSALALALVGATVGLVASRRRLAPGTL